MPRRTEISYTSSSDVTFAPSPPLGGEGWGEGGCAVRRHGVSGRRTTPAPFAASRLFPLPLEGARDVRVVSECCKYVARDAFDIVQDFGIGESQYPVAARFESGSPRRVFAFPSGMTVAVEFDDEPFGAASEIGDVRSEDDLPLEFNAETVGAERFPERAFGRGHICPEFLGALSCDRMPFRHSPSPNPLPLKGERAQCKMPAHA